MSCHIYPMSMSLHKHSDLKQIEIELTPEQTEVLVQTPARRQCAPELEPLPIEILTDPLLFPLHQATSPEGEASEGEELWLLESDVMPLERESPRKPLRTGGVGTLVRVLLYIGLLVGITYVRQIGEEPIQVAQKVAPNPARVGEERAPTAPSADSEAMLIKNPFDRTEAFEFPPGTSKTEARQAVAKLLMERAHDRLPLLAEAPPRRGATAKHGTQKSSQL